MTVGSLVAAITVRAIAGGAAVVCAVPEAGEAPSRRATLATGWCRRWKTKLGSRESSWTLNLLVCFNVEKNPFDDVRVRRALWDRGRSLGRQPRPVPHLDASRGRRSDPARLAVRDAGVGAGQTSRFFEGHQEVSRGSQEAAGRCRRAQPDVHLANRNLAMPYTPLGRGLAVVPGARRAGADRGLGLMLSGNAADFYARRRG